MLDWGNSEKENKIEILKKLIKKMNEDKKYDSFKKFESLKPKKDIKIKSITALNFAFKDKDNKNIAITGNYSSGKSSLIESYINKKLNFFEKKKLNVISLATFLTENEEVTVEKLEKYIIEQLYYSTYKKLLDNNADKSKYLAIFIYLLILCIILIVKWDILYFYFFLRRFKLAIAIIFILFSIVIVYILKNIFKYVYKIDKFALQIMELNIEIGSDGSNKNIINENMELIIKIFKQFKYKYIIFEDLDRFDKPIIFEHLRELNNVLNKNMNVKFFYLIKDDVFKDENRTKFFDYIYPVVPYVSYTSSGEELYKLIRKYGLGQELPEAFIKNLTVFVQDMRILKNVLNEYRVYKKELNNEGIDARKLFAIILYKNVFSEDFSKLQKWEGNLYNIFNKKEEKILEMENKILENKKLIKNSELNLIEEKNIFCRSVERVIEQYWTSTGYSSTPTLKNSQKGNVNLSLSLKLDFEYIIDENTVIFGMSKSLLQYLKERHKELYELQEKINEQQNVDVDLLQDEIEDLESQVTYLKDDADLQDLFKNEYITDKDLEIFYQHSDNTENIRKDKLIKYILQEGYIDENYDRYIQRFHAGISFSKRDNDFFGNCLINRANDFIGELDNPTVIVRRLDVDRFKYKSVLNINILKTLLEEIDLKFNTNFNFEEYIEKIEPLKLQADEKLSLISNKLIKFIETFISKENFGENLKIVKQKLTEQEYKKFCVWLSTNPKVFKQIIDSSELTEIKNEILEEIMMCSSLENIKKSKELHKLKKYIEENGLFLEDYITDKIVEIISELEIKYNHLSYRYIFSEEVFEYCIKHNNYKININNIESVVRYISNVRYGNIDNQMKRNYSIMKECEEVFEYINSNINVYYKEIYLKQNIARNYIEDVILMLNNENLSKEDKLEIICRESKKENEDDTSRIGLIESLKEIKDEEIYNNLLDSGLVKMSYRNLSVFYKSMIDFEMSEDISEQEKANIQKEIEIAKDNIIKFINTYGKSLKNDINTENITDLFVYLGIENRIDDEIFEIIIKGISTSYRTISKKSLENLSKNKRKILIENRKIILNDTNYNRIRELGGEDFILYTYEYRNEIKNCVHNYKFNSYEILSILKSPIFHWNFKNRVIWNLVNYENYQFESNNANEIAKYILDKKLKVDFSIEQLRSFMSRIAVNLTKVKLTNLYFSKLNKDNVEAILKNELKYYEKLIIDKNKPVYHYHIELEKLIRNLISIGYNIRYKIENNKIVISPTNR